MEDDKNFSPLAKAILQGLKEALEHVNKINQDAEEDKEE